MRTALDTNIISSLWSNEPNASLLSSLLSQAKREGVLVMSGAVYAELLAYPGASEAYQDDFIRRTKITVDFRADEWTWREAGRRFALHAAQRRRTPITSPRRILADFFIGTHALKYADRLLTLDLSLYVRNFPELPLFPLTPPKDSL